MNVTQDGFDKVSESLRYRFLKGCFVLVILIGTFVEMLKDNFLLCAKL